MEEILTPTPAVDLLGEEWADKLGYLFEPEGNLTKLGKQINARRKRVTIYPDHEDVFRAFKLTPFSKVDVVILGMDPYNNGPADGLAFSSKYTDVYPPSLQKIHDRIEHELYGGLNVNLKTDRDLLHWAEQGIFLFNSALTVEYKTPGAHAKHWAPFTRLVLEKLNDAPQKIIYLLWGKKSQAFRKYIDENKHFVRTAEHPAAAAYNNREWYSEGCFVSVQEHLKAQNKELIAWDAHSWLPF